MNKPVPIPPEIRDRKGPRSRATIDPVALDLLNRGLLDSKNLSEWLAIDNRELLRNFLEGVGQASFLPAFEAEFAQYKSLSTLKIMPIIARVMHAILPQINNAGEVMQKMHTHASDTVRCWACYVIGEDPDMTLSQKLEAIKEFAGDPHFGVRECAWLALRPAIEADLDTAIVILSEWAKDPDENIRRFASEATRPKGVWTQHIGRLKTEPELGLLILEKLRDDRSKYVRDSVGNWLNDASYTAPEWVASICDRWKSESKTRETQYIVRKAMRTIKKKAKSPK